MMRLLIANRIYSSWSLRGWLAAKLSGLPCETVVVPMDTPEWQDAVARGDIPSGKVPVLWDHGQPVWDSLAIVMHLADRGGHDRFWPREADARGLAYAISAEMHSGFQSLRAGCPMNLSLRFPSFEPSAEIMADVARIETLGRQARQRFGADSGEPWLFGRFGAADAMYAPVCTRIDTYHLPVAPDTRAYIDAVLAHPWMQEWTREARAETFPLDRYHIPGGVPA